VAALSGFRRFPAWMWRNRDVVALTEWLRERNAPLPGEARAGFYGLDLYSLFSSIEEVLRYLDEHDPEGARRARARYACFDHFGEDSQRYGYATGYGLAPPCERQVIAQLSELQARVAADSGSDPMDADALFHAEQNARLVKNAERYYRAMFEGKVSSWNLRDRHMADTLEALAAHLSRPGRESKVVVWEHNSHLGDARATELGREGEWNVGQLARVAYGEDAFLVGFTTHHGTVTAASEWDGPAECKQVRPALAGSWERAFHDTRMPRFLLPLRGAGSAAPALDAIELLERAIGVIYRPETERQSHYFSAAVARQFDAVIHIDETSALQALDGDVPAGGEAPETYPRGL
jgi:erythromycin esterase-like protein